MGDFTLAVKRELPAPREVVFQAFVDRDRFVKWFGPEGITPTNVHFIPRVGGRYQIEMQPTDGEPFHISGEVRELDPPSRFAFTFIYDEPNPDDVANLVSLSFHDLGGSTEVDVAHGPFTTEERRALHMAGWNDSFDRLERLLASSA
jgi:uncharacterized protein YndB with AHSA1/START domain